MISNINHPKNLTGLWTAPLLFLAGFVSISCVSNQRIVSGLSKAEQTHKTLHIFPFDNSEKFVQQKFYSYVPVKKKFTWYDSSGHGYEVDLPRIAIRTSKAKKEIFVDEKVSRMDVFYTNSDGSESVGEGYLKGAYLLVRYVDKMYYSPQYSERPATGTTAPYKPHAALITDLLRKTKYSWPINKEFLLTFFPPGKANVDIRHWSPYGEKWSPGINNYIGSMDPTLQAMDDATFIVYKFSGHGRQINMTSCLTALRTLKRNEPASTEEIEKELRDFPKVQQNYQSDIGWYACASKIDNIDFINGGDLYMWSADSDIGSAGKLTEPTDTPKAGNQGVERQLKELKSLFNKGLITKEEYGEKRKALLDGM